MNVPAPLASMMPPAVMRLMGTPVAVLLATLASTVKQVRSLQHFVIKFFFKNVCKDISNCLMSFVCVSLYVCLCDILFFKPLQSIALHENIIMNTPDLMMNIYKFDFILSIT